MRRINNEVFEDKLMESIFLSNNFVSEASTLKYFIALLVSLLMVVVLAGIALFFYNMAGFYANSVINEIDALIKGIILYFPANIFLSLAFYFVYNVCRLIYYRYD